MKSKVSKRQKEDEKSLAFVIGAMWHELQKINSGCRIGIEVDAAGTIYVRIYFVDSGCELQNYSLIVKWRNVHGVEKWPCGKDTTGIVRAAVKKFNSLYGVRWKKRTDNNKVA